MFKIECLHNDMQTNVIVHKARSCNALVNVMSREGRTDNLGILIK